MKKTKRKRILAILALPVVIVIFAVGWVLYWLGKKQHSQKKKKWFKISRRQRAF